MSKAFTKEEEEIPERVGRLRSASGLPPGALNYLSAEGARLLRAELAKARGARAVEVRRILESTTVVPASAASPEEVLFGSTVHVRTSEGAPKCYRIVGVDETNLIPDAVSWVSPLGKTLLGARLGQRIRLPDGADVIVESIG